MLPNLYFKSLYSYKSALLENLCKTTSLECKTSTFGWRESLKNVFAKAPHYFSLIT